VICTKLDRWGRSLKDLIETMNFLEAHKVSMIFLDQNIDLSSPMGKMLFQILGAVAEFERNLIVERTSEGRMRAMLHGTRSKNPYMALLRTSQRRQLSRDTKTVNQSKPSQLNTE